MNTRWGTSVTFPLPILDEALGRHEPLTRKRRPSRQPDLLGAKL